MSDYTPGSWQVSKCRRGKLGAPPNEHESYLEIRSDFYGAGTIKNGPEATICEISLEPKTAVDCNSGFQHKTDPEANARLIAAAPDLLEACQWYMHQYDSAHDGVDKGETPTRIRAAIAKATTAT